MADSTTNITQIEASQAQKEVTANGLFDAASQAMAYGRRAEACAGLTWGYYGTRYGGDVVANGTHLCDANETTYMMVELATGDVFFSNEGSDSDPDWDDPEYARCYIITTGTSSVTSYEDHRFGPRGIMHAASTGSLVIGVDVQAWDASLDDIAGLTATTDNFMQAKSSAWASRTPAQVAADLRTPINGLNNVVSALATSGTVDIDCALGDYFTLAASGNVTSITFSNLPGSGKGATKWIQFTQDSTPRTVTWPASFKWAGGVAGAVSTGSGAVDELAITTVDNGTTWKATLAKAFA